VFWSVLRFVVAVLGMTIALAGFAAFVAAAIGVWSVKAETDRKTALLQARAYTAVDAANRAVEFVREVIRKAEEDLRNARQSPREQPPPVNPLVQLTARQASQDLAGSVEQAQTAVVTASDAMVVAQAALEMFGAEEQYSQLAGVSPEQVAQTRADLERATRELNRAKTVLGIFPISNGEPTPEQLRMVESALGQARGFTDQMDNVVKATRTRVGETKQKADLWTQRIAWGTTFVGALAALGQVFMGRFFWRVLRRKPA
jgi:hydrogenase maturation protease